MKEIEYLESIWDELSPRKGVVSLRMSGPSCKWSCWLPDEGRATRDSLLECVQAFKEQSERRDNERN